MSVLNDVGAFLAAAPQSLGTVGTDLFLGTMPSDPNACGAVYETGGLAPEGGFGVLGVQYETPGVQVVFRGDPHDYAGPRAKAETAYRSLAAVQPGTIVGGSAQYLTVHPQQSPFLMRRDENQRVYIACNFLCQKEPS